MISDQCRWPGNLNQEYRDCENWPTESVFLEIIAKKWLFAQLLLPFVFLPEKNDLVCLLVVNPLLEHTPRL